MSKSSCNNVGMIRYEWLYTENVSQCCNQACEKRRFGKLIFCLLKEKEDGSKNYYIDGRDTTKFLMGSEVAKIRISRLKNNSIFSFSNVLLRYSL